MRRQLQNPSEWNRWFAWRPSITGCGKLVWWEHVERRMNPYFRGGLLWDYRIPNED